MKQKTTNKKNPKAKATKEKTLPALDYSLLTLADWNALPKDHPAVAHSANYFRNELERIKRVFHLTPPPDWTLRHVQAFHDIIRTAQPGEKVLAEETGKPIYATNAIYKAQLKAQGGFLSDKFHKLAEPKKTFYLLRHHGSRLPLSEIAPQILAATERDDRTFFVNLGKVLGELKKRPQPGDPMNERLAFGWTLGVATEHLNRTLPLRLFSDNALIKVLAYATNTRPDNGEAILKRRRRLGLGVSLSLIKDVEVTAGPKDEKRRKTLKYIWNEKRLFSLINRHQFLDA